MGRLILAILGVVTTALRALGGQPRPMAACLLEEETAVGRVVTGRLHHWQLAPSRQDDWPPLPAGATGADASILLAVARTRYEVGEPLTLDEVMLLYASNVDLERPFGKDVLLAGVWLDWLMDVAPRCWQPWVGHREGYGIIVEELLPAWVGQTEEVA